MLSYEEKKQRLIDTLRQRQNGNIRLQKNTSNLFRDRDENGASTRLNVRDFNQVIEVNADEHWVDVEGMTTYADLVDATLAHGVMPTVVPELKSITIGGAVSGIGIESSSFKYGFPHETVLEMDVLLGDGEVVTCTSGNNHQDLYFGIPNSYGTLGYVLRLKAKVIPVRPYVHVQHIRHHDARALFAELETRCSDADFIDGTAFSPDELYLTLGHFSDSAPYTSDYTFENIYYRSIQQKESDYLTTHDYIWRWDTDWFWCSKHLYVQNPLLRRIVGKKRLNSTTYTKVMRWNSRWQVVGKLEKLLGYHSESVIQDIPIPVDNAAEFLEFLHREIGISPVWMCPVKAYDPNKSFYLWPSDPNQLYINFGFWEGMRSRQQYPPAYRNRKIEKKLRELGGIKSLYSDTYYGENEFWQIYNKPVYDQLKSRYDAQGAFKDLYSKAVLRN